MINPDFSGEGFVGSLGVCINLVRRAVDDVNVAAIGFPAGCPGSSSEALVGKSDAAIVLLFEFVSCSARRGITAFPELFDEIIAFFGGGESNKCGTFRVISDVDDVIVEPLFVVV